MKHMIKQCIIALCFLLCTQTLCAHKATPCSQEIKQQIAKTIIKKLAEKDLTVLKKIAQSKEFKQAESGDFWASFGIFYAIGLVGPWLIALGCAGCYAIACLCSETESRKELLGGCFEKAGNSF